MIYAVSSAPEEAAKQAAAQDPLGSGELVFSVQVPKEFYCQVARPGRSGGLSHESAVLCVEEPVKWTGHPVSVLRFRSAAAVSQRYRISYWDAAIMAAAPAMGCDLFYTEDLNSARTWRERTERPFTRCARARIPVRPVSGPKCLFCRPTLCGPAGRAAARA